MELFPVIWALNRTFDYVDWFIQSYKMIIFFIFFIQLYLDFVSWGTFGLNICSFTYRTT